MLIICTHDTMPPDFVPLAENFDTYELCGKTEQSGYETVSEIPANFKQICVPGCFGEHLTVAQIEEIKPRFDGTFEKLNDAVISLALQLAEVAV